MAHHDGCCFVHAQSTRLVQEIDHVNERHLTGRDGGKDPTENIGIRRWGGKDGRSPRRTTAPGRPWCVESCICRVGTKKWEAKSHNATGATGHPPGTTLDLAHGCGYAPGYSLHHDDDGCPGRGKDFEILPVGTSVIPTPRREVILQALLGSSFFRVVRRLHRRGTRNTA